jgi:Predicted membrane protein
MAFCPNCGASVEGKFCAKCGSAVGSAGPGPVPGAQAYTAPPPGAQTYSQPQTSGMADNVASALCYVLGLITGILFLVLAPYNQNKTIRFHAFQAIFFHVAWVVFWIVLTIVTMAMPWSLHILITLFSLVLSLGGLLVWILLIVKAYNNDRFKLPVIGDLAEKQA